MFSLLLMEDVVDVAKSQDIPLLLQQNGGIQMQCEDYRRTIHEGVVFVSYKFYEVWHRAVSLWKSSSTEQVDGGTGNE